MRRHLKLLFTRPTLAIVFALALLSLALAGCTEDDSAVFAVSLHPFFTAQDLESDADLPGTWVHEDEDVSFTFSQSEGNVYQIVVHEKDGERQMDSRFEGHLIRLGATEFLDFCPTDIAEGSEFYQLHLLRSHSVARVEFAHDSLKLTFLSASWLNARFKDKTLDIPHESLDGIILLNGTTQELQDLLFLNASDDDAFHDPLELQSQQTQEKQ